MGIKKRTKKVIHWLFHHKHRFINGTKGVISILLSILMVPFTSIALSLVNAARVNSAVAIFDEALCNASNSTLGTYESFLKKRFGLLAVSQNSKSNNDGVSQYTTTQFINETFQFYLEQNQKSLSNTYTTYESSSAGVYPLADNDVLLSQILEYSKYSVPTKLVEDKLSLDDMIKSLEGALPGSNIFKLITSGAGVANSMITLGEDLDLLKDAISEQDIATGNYTDKYNDFEGSVSDYVDKLNEMNKKINDLGNKIESENSTINNINKQISDINDEIDKLNKEIDEINESDLSEEEKKKQIEEKQETIEEKQDEIENLQDSLKSSNNKKGDYESQLETKKSSYKKQLDALKENIVNDKKNYSGCISTIINKLQTTKNKLISVKGDIVDMGSSVTGLVSTSLQTGLKDTEDEVKSKKLELTKQRDNTTNNDAKEKLQSQIDDLDDTLVNLKNSKTVAQKTQSAYQSGMSDMKDNIEDYDEGKYDIIINQLTEIRNKVDSYDTENVKSKLNKSDYFLDFSLLSYDAVKSAEDNLVAEYAKSSIWSTIKAIIGFFQALCSCTLFYDSKLSAVIDNGFYDENYGGLPSDKDRSAHPLYYGEDGDEELSNYYKSLLGEYSSQDLDALGSFDLIETLKNIVSDIGSISSNIGKLFSIIGLLNFAKIFKNIVDAVGRITDNLKSAMSFFANALSKTSVYKKILLGGYVNYMTSDRTTYEGKCLTGAKFNLREQEPSTELNSNIISDLSALVSTISKSVSGGSDKCFVGAEKEYIIYGSSSEMVNQCSTFGTIYILRIFMNLLAIFKSGEVASIAAACTIASPVVYLIYILVEPLVDTVILVNGGEVPIMKNLVYLTPSGLQSLIEHFSSIKLNTEEINQAKVGFLDSLGQTKYAEVQSAFPSDNISDTKNAKDKKIWQISYSDMLLLMITICISKDRILERMSNLIAMETNEYLKGQGKFDLDYSYTYIRTEASFTTNEFISISEKSGINSKKRIVYRGY